MRFMILVKATTEARQLLGLEAFGNGAGLGADRPVESRDGSS